jgi:5-hydroxyisourate hydrolase-like protein (transthyretin family)
MAARLARTRRTTVLGALVLAALVFFSLTTMAQAVDDGPKASPGSAVQIDSGQITGSVTASDTGLPIAGVAVKAYVKSGEDTYDERGTTTTNASGAYSIGPLANGDYYVQFGRPWESGYLTEYYKAAPSLGARRFQDSEKVTVTAPTVSSGIDATLDRAGSIAGYVTDSKTNLPIANVSVSIIPAPADNTVIAWATTDATGYWKAPDIYEGSYYVTFSDKDDLYRWEGWQHSHTDAGRTAVSLTFGKPVTDISASLDAFSKITGTVTAADGAPVEGIEVTALTRDGGSWTGPGDTGMTDKFGVYEIAGLVPGDYKVKFVDTVGDTQRFLSEYYDGSYELYGAGSGTTVTVSAPGSVVPGIDVDLDKPGKVTGTVTDAVTGLPLASAWVGIQYYSDGDWQEGNNANADSLGRYEFGSLYPGEYRVSFNADGYVPEDYDDAMSANAATLVSVSVEATTSGIDAALTPCGRIEGVVTDAVTNAPIPNIVVTVFSYDGSDDGWDEELSTTTNASGAYFFSGWRSGSYKVSFASENGAYRTEWYKGARTMDLATPVVMMINSTVKGIDATMDTAGHITGTVTAAAGGALLSDIDVTAFRSDGAGGWERGASVRSDSAGFYDIGSLNAGTYRVLFSDGYDGTHALEWWNDAATLAASTDVVVAAGATVPNVSAALGEPGSIAGTINNADGTVALWDTAVTVFQSDGSDGWIRVAGTQYPDHDYTIGGLRSGTYRVYFKDTSSVYAPEYYAGCATLGDATDVVVTAGATTPGIDASLDFGGAIAGTVHDGGGVKHLSHINVYAYASDGDGGWDLAGQDSTRGDGSYSIEHLASGAYRVRFGDWDGFYVSEWYDAAAAEGGAAPVDVTLGTTSDGIDATLEAATYDLAPQAGDGGAISPATTQTVEPAKGKKFTITPEAGYSIADVKVDGFSVGAVSSYEFTDVRQDYRIAATFTKTVVAPVAAFRMDAPRIGSTVRRNRSALFYGALDPAHKSGTTWVKLRFERLVGRRWRHVKTVSAFSYGKGYAWNHYGIWTRLGTRGSYRVKAYHPADSDGGAYWTGYTRFRVR